MTTGRDPVVVTGVGALTPVGDDAASTWEAFLSGRSGVTRLDETWLDEVPTKIAARAAVDPTEKLGRVEARRLDRCAQFVLAAARDAWADAGSPEVDGERLGTVVGTGIGGLITMMDAYDTYKERGYRRLSPYTVTKFMPNGPAATLSMEFGAKAGAHAAVGACASGAEALAAGLEMIRGGRADTVIVGGTEAAIHPIAVASFCAMMALSTRNDEPERASRPFDKARDGFVMGEGAAVLVLESAQQAARRGAHVYAELAGVGVSADAHHVAIPDPAGAGAALSMRRALDDAGIGPADVAHINAHATSTEVGDIAEAAAIRTAFADAVDRIAVSSTKSMTGHLLGAAGTLESLATILALRDGKAPPTLNLDDPDDEVQLNIVRDEARPLPEGATYAMNNSFGFGGHNVSLIFRRPR
ncbi:MAG: beta-ketoacyl-ACP synthase II [Streptosporangiaceae bacterium]